MVSRISSRDSEVPGEEMEAVDREVEEGHCAAGVDGNGSSGEVEEEAEEVDTGMVDSGPGEAGATDDLMIVALTGRGAVPSVQAVPLEGEVDRGVQRATGTAVRRREETGVEVRAERKESGGRGVQR